MPAAGDHSYLCSFCGHFFDALANSIDRTQEIRCPTCARGTPEAYDEPGISYRLGWMTG